MNSQTAAEAQHLARVIVHANEAGVCHRKSVLRQGLHENRARDQTARQTTARAIWSFLPPLFRVRSAGRRGRRHRFSLSDEFFKPPHPPSGGNHTLCTQGDNGSLRPHAGHSVAISGCLEADVHRGTLPAASRPSCCRSRRQNKCSEAVVRSGVSAVPASPRGCET